MLMLWVLFSPAPAAAATVRAEVDRNQAALNESIELMVTVDQDNSEVDTSPIKSFRVISRGSTTSVQIINTRMTRETRHSYTLIPVKTGRHTIPPLTVAIGGKQYFTQPIAIDIVKAETRPSAAQHVFVTASVSETNPVEGQQITYSFRFHYAVKFANARFQEPEFENFTADKIEKEKTYRKTIGGREFRVTQLDYVLMPLKTGALTIGPAMLQFDIVKSRRRSTRDPFDSFFNRGRLESKFLQTEPLTIQASPLPPYGGSVPFSGLVGRFSLTGELETDSLKAGDSSTLTIAVEGQGNVMDAQQPELQLPQSFKAYTDNPQIDVHLSAQGHRGRKVFKIALVPTEAGDYTLPPIALSYFDVERGSYQQLRSTKFTLEVSPSEETEKFQPFSASTQSEAPGVRKQKVEFTGRDILPLKRELDTLQNRSPFTLSWFILLLLAPVLGYIAVRVPLSRRRKTDNPKTRMAQKARQTLKQAAKSGEDEGQFLSLLHQAVTSAVLSVAGIEGELLTYREAETLLLANQCPLEETRKGVDLLKEIESVKYSGSSLSPGERTRLLSETSTWVRRISR